VALRAFAAAVTSLVLARFDISPRAWRRCAGSTGEHRGLGVRSIRLEDSSRTHLRLKNDHGVRSFHGVDPPSDVALLTGTHAPDVVMREASRLSR